MYAVYCKPPCDRVIVIRASSSLSWFVLALSLLFFPLTIHDLPPISDASDPASGYKLISGVCEESVVVDVFLLSTPIFIFPVPTAQKSRLLTAMIVREGIHRYETKRSRKAIYSIEFRFNSTVRARVACRAAMFSWPSPSFIIAHVYICALDFNRHLILI